MDLPTGTATFLFTDVEGSTRLAKALGASRYADVLEEHRRLLRDVFRAEGGIEVDSQGDAFFVAFRSASEAVHAAAHVQRTLDGHRWSDAPVRVRIGIHTGEAAVVDDGYRGVAVHRAARICSSAHGGQVVLSDTTRDLVEPDLPPEIRLLDLGLTELRDFDRPERLYQLVVDGLPETFPPLRAETAPRPRSGPSDLLERDEELAALDASIAEVRTGGRLLAVEGPAGIGKTRLLTEARARGEAAGMIVLGARGSELEREFSYGIVRQLFEPSLAASSPQERAALLAGAAGLATPIFDPVELEAGSGADPSLPMLHGLFWLTANLAEHRPVLLAVDDLHWCDQPSLRWLAYLLPRIDGLPVLVAVGLRPAEPGADLTILAHITADPRATVLRPGALTEGATGRLLGHMLSTDVEPVFAAALHEESGGNPLFVRELASAVTAEGLTPTASSVSSVRELGGQAVSRAVSLRLSRLSPEATRLAQTVAILGDGAEPRHAAALAELDEETAADSADDLKRVQILRHEPAWAFVHPVVRSAVYAELPAGERARQHRRAALLLAKSAVDPERIAAQLLPTSGRGDAWAVSALREAARSAVARGAPDGAVAYLRRALEEPPGEQMGAVLHELGSAEARIAAPEALAHLAEARAAARDARSRGEIALELVRAQFALGEPARASVEVLQEAIGELPVDDGSELALELETQLVGIARQDPELQPLAAERLRRLRAALPQLSAGRAVVLANLASAAAHAGVGRGEAIELAEQALADGSLLKDHFDPEFIYAVDTLNAADRLDAAFRLYGEAIDDAARRGLAAQYFLALCYRSAVAFLRGSLADAVADAELCLAAIETNGLESFRPTAVAMLARPLIERGEGARAREALDSASRGLDAFESAMPMSASFFVARARLRLEEGAYEEVVHDLVGRGQRAIKSGLRNPALFAWRSLAALALLGLGRNEEARRYAAEELALSREWGAPRSLGRSLIASGLAEGGDDGIELLREAVDVLEPSEARFEYARALVELGAALRRANRRAESREPLRGGLEQATRCGAAPLAERAATELLAAGARPRRVALSGVESLTPSERRVAQMAADGGTNREIAQELFVTPKTVEVHLSSAYRKLDISARSQLAAALAVPAPAGSTAGE